MCDFVFSCESSMEIRIKFKQETAAVECKESMVLMHPLSTLPCTHCQHCLPISLKYDHNTESASFLDSLYANFLLPYISTPSQVTTHSRTLIDFSFCKLFETFNNLLQNMLQ